MIYLLVKFTFIFLLACTIGFMFGYWWVRRRYIDVTESYSMIPDTDIPRSSTFDINPMIQKIEHLESIINNISIPRVSNTVNLEPLTEKVDRMETTIKTSHLAQESDRVNFQALQLKVNTIERLIAELLEHKIKKTEMPGAALLAKTPETHTSPKRVEENKKDDLKQISGIGPKLEKLLNNHGVNYFRQIAIWGPEEIEEINNQLKVFKGRITRDDWVGQAKALENTP